MKDQDSANRFSTEIDYRQRINKAMIFIQSNFHRELSINEVAGCASFSPYHFHRIFRAFTGETLGDYMNRVRMIKAAALISGGLPSAEAAKSVGYQTPSAFTKAFKKTFGTLPSTFRQQESDEIKYIPRPGTASKDLLKPEFRVLPSMKLWIVHKKGKLDENFPKLASEAFDELHASLNKYKIEADASVHLGILKDFDLVSSRECRYDACIVMTETIKSRTFDSIDTGMIYEGKWAVFIHKGPYDTLWQTWNRIYNSWYPLSGMELRDADPFEIYLYDKRTVAASELVTEIHIPVKGVI